MLKIQTADLIHEYNNACHVNVPQGKVCDNCLAIAIQILLWLCSELQIQGVKPVDKGMRVK